MADTIDGDTPYEDEDVKGRAGDDSENQFGRGEFIPAGASSSSDQSTDDLEAAYLRALEAMESEEWAIDSETEGEVKSAEFDDELDEPVDPAAIVLHGTDVLGPVSSGHETSFAQRASTGASETPSSADLADFNLTKVNLVQEASRGRPTSPIDEIETAGADFLGGPISKVPEAAEHLRLSGRSHPAESHAGPSIANKAEIPDVGALRIADATQPAPNATRIIESCLFVGGQPLSTRRLATLLESTSESSVLEHLIDELNLEYASQQRPYEIRLGDGGYRMALRTEFEAVRNRVYGVGPRDVKLSQDVLEVLALVAFQQPITHAAVEACGKPNVANILRQLLRRELITLVRIDQTRNGVEYRTSPRFLQVFGLANLNELPRPEELSIR
ncbi:MAG: hypothetical protein JWM11_6191 [Planctomycetaceae bacterium]|nr:hypothetical protein [Planctomycetaceae bacterium]